MFLLQLRWTISCRTSHTSKGTKCIQKFLLIVFSYGTKKWLPTIMSQEYMTIDQQATVFSAKMSIIEMNYRMGWGLGEHKSHKSIEIILDVIRHRAISYSYSSRSSYYFGPDYVRSKSVQYWNWISKKLKLNQFILLPVQMNQTVFFLPRSESYTIGKEKYESDKG